MERPEVQQAAPTNGGGFVGAAANINDQQDSIERPSVGADSDYSDGIGGINKIGQAATAEVKIKATNRAEEQMAATNKQVGADMQAAQNGMSSFNDMQQGVSVSPKLGANGAAVWINANNNKYHDFDGYYGAQCVDLYNFYMTGFVGGKSSVGMGGVGYAQELWGNHDRSALVQVAKNQTPQMGDIAIWSNGMNGMGGHVAIVAQSNGNGTIRVLNANVASNGGSKGTSVMSNLSTGNLLGYLRPKKLM
jgi:surface antigen